MQLISKGNSLLATTWNFGVNFPNFTYSYYLTHWFLWVLRQRLLHFCDIHVFGY